MNGSDRQGRVEGRIRLGYWRNWPQSQAPHKLDTPRCSPPAKFQEAIGLGDPMTSKYSSVQKCSRAKAGVCVALILTIFTVYVQPAVAVTPAVPKTNAQLLGGLLGGGGLLGTNRYIVRDTK